MAKRKTDIDNEQEVTLARIDERLKAIVESNTLIYAEVKKTNGRVTNIENERLPSLEHWRSRMKGVWIAVIFFCTALSTVIGFGLHFLTK